MAQKTIIKHLLSKWGLLSVELQNAIKFDQAVIDKDKAYYIDNPSNDDSASVLDGAFGGVEEVEVAGEGEREIEEGMTNAELDRILFEGKDI
jgi:recombinational DNA repair protein RecT